MFKSMTKLASNVAHSDKLFIEWNNVFAADTHRIISFTWKSLAGKTIDLSRINYRICSTFFFQYRKRRLPQCGTISGVEYVEQLDHHSRRFCSVCRKTRYKFLVMCLLRFDTKLLHPCSHSSVSSAYRVSLAFKNTTN